MKIVQKITAWYSRYAYSVEIWISLGFVLLLSMLLLGGSTLAKSNTGDRVRTFTRSVEFDFVDWMAEALVYKVRQAAFGSERFLPAEARKEIVMEMLDLVRQSQEMERKIETIYADPQVSDPKEASAEMVEELDAVKSRLKQIQPAAEAILQNQVSEVVNELGLTLGGQPLPPVLYHGTPLPYAMIISPRDVIRQDADISLSPDLDIEQITQLEEKVSSEENVSTLVVPIGGVGVYPTMVSETANLAWLSEVVSHEWIHNFLTMRPLGVSYLNSPELRIMNETSASIAGKEIGRAVLERYYPELLPPPPSASAPAKGSNEKPAEPVFDFRKEMHTTRLTAEEYLAEGKIEEAEEYMETRRVFFWENGYRIRKLNQAYFAFYGAYADQPGGAGGEDPVGAAVRKLRSESDSLASFIKRIAWMSSFEDLQNAVN